MKITTWNINSVRLRSALVLRLIEQENPDIICPRDVFTAAGYPHIHINGMKGYNGVAIISKHPFENAQIHNRVGRTDCRHISARINGIDIHNLYIPAGGDEPDPAINDKFAHKLDFVDELTHWFADTYTPDQRVIAVGDFNIAPYEHDVWSHKQLLKVVSHTPPETDRLGSMLASLNWIDVARHFTPMDEKIYTWWSYRNRDWKKSNRGRRLDHIWVTQNLKTNLKTYSILPEARDWEQPSDHVPVSVVLDLPA